MHLSRGVYGYERLAISYEMIGWIFGSLFFLGIVFPFPGRGQGGKQASQLASQASRKAASKQLRKQASKKATLWF